MRVPLVTAVLVILGVTFRSSPGWLDGIIFARVEDAHVQSHRLCETNSALLVVAEGAAGANARVARASFVVGAADAVAVNNTRRVFRGFMTAPAHAANGRQDQGRGRRWRRRHCRRRWRGRSRQHTDFEARTRAAVISGGPAQRIGDHPLWPVCAVSGPRNGEVRAATAAAIIRRFHIEQVQTQRHVALEVDGADLIVLKRGQPGAVGGVAGVACAPLKV